MNRKALEAFYSFKPRPVDAWMFETELYRRQIEQQIMLFPSYVLPSPEEPLALCGIAYVNGVGTVWLVTGEGFERKAGMVARQMRELCIAAYKVFRFNRIHMMVDSNNPAAQGFAEKLGFVCEAKNLKAMGARGENMDIFLLERNSSWVD